MSSSPMFIANIFQYIKGQNCKPSRVWVPFRAGLKDLCTFASTVKSRFNESWFKVKSRFKVQNIATKMEYHIKKSRFKESKCADGGHSLNRDFTVHYSLDLMNDIGQPLSRGFLSNGNFLDMDPFRDLVAKISMGRIAICSWFLFLWKPSLSALIDSGKKRAFLYTVVCVLLSRKEGKDWSWFIWKFFSYFSLRKRNLAICSWRRWEKIREKSFPPLFHYFVILSAL